MTMPPSADLVVVGSGICGTATAASAAGRGLAVLVVDKESGPAAEASGQAQGVIRVQGREAAEIPLAREALERWHAVAESAGREVDLRFEGNLYIAQHEGELPELRALVEEGRRAGLTDVRLLSAEEVRDQVPAARGPLSGGMWSPSDGHCDPAGATKHFLESARRRGAIVRYGVKATRILERRGRVVGLETDDGSVATERVVVAAGVWSPHLLATAGLRVPIKPVMLSEGETAPLPPLFGCAVRAAGFGGRQRSDGRIRLSAGLNARVSHGLSLYDLLHARAWSARLVAHRRSVRLSVDWTAVRRQLRNRSLLGAGLITTAARPAPERGQLESARRAMSGVFPDVAGAPLERAWAGRLDMSLDGRPIIDAAGPAGVAFVCGLSGHGLTLAPVLGEIAVDLAVDGATARPIHPFRLSRFREGAVPVPARTI
jgi:glycine/D-amino acid oxidase-like deaminating enzyme